jgi:dihydroneopterin aldolase
MSLETELAKNTAALAAMTEALTTLRIILETPTAPVADLPVFAEVVVEDSYKKAAEKIMDEPFPIIEEVVEVPKPTTPTDVGTATISYAEVAAAIVSTFKADRNKTVAALAQFGAKKGPELKPEDYEDFLNLLTS